MRAYKTINDSYIEPISFTVPRRAETFQADIFPPAIGTKPAASAKEWFDGKTAMPAKIDLESVYEGTAPKEVPSGYKPPPAQSAPAPASKPDPKKEEPPKPAAAAAARAPPPAVEGQKGSLAAVASRFQDKEEDGEAAEDDEASSFEEVPRPTQRSAALPTRAEPPKPNVAAPAASAKTSPPPIDAAAPSATTSAAGPAPGVGAGVETSLDQIKQLIQDQTKIISAQNDRIGHLTAEFEALKKKVTASAGSQDQSERIRQLELELEEARS